MSEEGLRINLKVWRALVAHAQGCLPEEACGLLAGHRRTAHRVILVENIEHSSTRYRMEPQAQVDAMMDIERQGEELVGIFHSHPSGPPGLSESDRMEARYPEPAYLVLSPTSGEWEGRAYRLDSGGVRAVSLVIGGAGTSEAV